MQLRIRRTATAIWEEYPMLTAMIVCWTTLLITTGVAANAPPQAKFQAPGFYRLMLGDYEVTVLSDGTATRAVDEIMSKPREVRDALTRERRTPPIDISINAFLIHTGSKLILVDTGAGELFGARCGRLVANLRAAGYKPEQIDAVLLTHIHADHSGGLSIKGKRVFENALVYVDKRDPAFWLGEAEEKAAPASRKETFRQSHAAVEPYVKADKLRPFDGAGELFPGIRAIPAYGHTPGHTAYRVESRGQRLLLWGDTVHLAEAQFPDPTITIEYDVDREAAVASRQKLLAGADKEGYLVGGAHISFPGLGHVRADGTGYRWIPRPYDAGQ
jgi:glyoxylase-like metal-dependent hydrolase (beta-lactamase superfamily II)